MKKDEKILQLFNSTVGSCLKRPLLATPLYVGRLTSCCNWSCLQA